MGHRRKRCDTVRRSSRLLIIRSPHRPRRREIQSDAVQANLGRLSSRHALAAARPVHVERVEQAQGPDAVRRRECGRREALDRQERRRLRHVRRRRRHRHAACPRQAAARRQDGRGRSLQRLFRKGPAPSRRPASARQGPGPRRRRRRGHLRHPGRLRQDEGPGSGRRDAAHLQRLHAQFQQLLSRPHDRPGLPALQQHRGRRARSPPRRQDGHEGRRAVLLVAHDADVAPDVGSAMGGGQRDAAAAAFPHLPGDRPRAAQVARAGDLPPHDL